MQGIHGTDSATIVLLLLLPLCCSANRPLEVTLGRYNNLVIGIHRSVPENATLIDEIKSVVNDASNALVLATRRSGGPGGLAFGNVSILVPDTWSRRYSPATWQLYSKAQLRVAPRNPRYGPVPHTEGAGGCGVPGDFSHFPTDFFLDPAQAARLFVNRARLMVHEFAHLRWGLMDEAPQENDPQFYIHQGRFYPSRCSDQLDGKMANRHTGQPCKIDMATLLPEPDCIFIPDQDNRAVASLMGHYYVNSMRTFCDHTSHQNEAYRHNRVAPTQQNRLCRSRSVWQVMGHHEDFQKERPQEVDFQPTIEVVQAQTRDVVAVLDVSESMLSPDGLPFKKLKSAMVNYIRSVLESEARLGIVQFSSGAKEVSPIQLLGPAGSANRTKMEAAVRILDALGLTDIGDGLMMGLRKLQQVRPDGGGLLFLVSDGEEQRTSGSVYTFDDAAAAIKAAGVTVDVLGLGPEADRRIGDLARDTGGSFYSSYSNQNSFDLFSALLNSAVRTDASPETPVLLHSVDLAAAVSSTGFAATDSSVLIDSSARGQLLFVFLLPTKANVRSTNVTVTSPDGTVFGEGDIVRDVDIGMLSVQLGLDSFRAGEWKVRLNAQIQASFAAAADRTVSLVVTTKAAAGGGPAIGPIIAAASLSTFKLANNSALVNENGEGGGGVRIDTVLQSGAANGAAVLGAEVRADVRTPDGQLLTVALLDNGAGADRRADDGLYSGLLSPRQLTAKGDYLVSVSVKSVDGQTGIIVAPAASPAAVAASVTAGAATPFVAKADYTRVPVSNLTRTAMAGSFKLENFSKEEKEVDRVPPSQIASLDLVSVNATANSMIVTFIAVGDDFDQGMASKYEAYWATSPDNLTSSNQPGTGVRTVQPEQIILGDLTAPAVAGKRERLGVKFPSTTFADASPVLFLTVRAVDAAGNRGGLSFPVSAPFRELTFADTGRPEPPTSGGNPSLGVIIGVVVSVVVVAVVIAAVYWGLRKPGSRGGGSGGGSSGARAFSSAASK